MKTYEVKVYPNGRQYWYKNGEPHREDGPAIIYPNGTQYWYKDGKIHREDGPAVIYSNGTQYWYKDGKEYTEKEFDKQTKTCDGKVVEIDGVKYKLTLV
jgi:hypothetical protein